MSEVQNDNKIFNYTDSDMKDPVPITRFQCMGCLNIFFVLVMPEAEPKFCPYCGAHITGVKMVEELKSW